MTKRYQIISKRSEKDYFVFRIAAPKQGDTDKFIDMLLKERSFLKDALDDGTLNSPVVEWCKPTDLDYNPRTGKLKSIIDMRK